MDFLQRLAGRRTPDDIGLNDIERGRRDNQRLPLVGSQRAQDFEDPLGVYEGRVTSHQSIPPLGSPISLRKQGEKRPHEGNQGAENGEYTDRTDKVRIIKLGSRAAVDERDAMIEQYQIKIAGLESHTTELERLVADTKRKDLKATTETSSREKEIEMYKLKLAELDARAIEGNKRISELERSLNDKEKTATQAASDALCKDAKIKRFEDIIAQLKTSASEANKKYSQLLADFEKKVRQAETDASRSDMLIKEYETRVAEQEASTSGANQRVSQLESMLADCEKNVGHARNDAVNKDSIIQISKAMIAKLEIEASLGRDRVSQLETQLADAGTMIVEAGKYKSLSDQLTAQINEQKAKYVLLEGITRTAHEKVSQLEKQLENAERRIAEASMISGDQTMTDVEATKSEENIRAALSEQFQQELHTIKLGFDKELSEANVNAQQKIKEMVDGREQTILELQRRIKDSEDANCRYMEILKEANRQCENHRLSFEREQEMRIQAERNQRSNEARHGNIHDIPGNVRAPAHGNTPNPMEGLSKIPPVGQIRQESIVSPINAQDQMDEEEDIPGGSDIEMEAKKQTEKRQGKQREMTPMDDLDNASLARNVGRKTMIPPPRQFKHPRGGQGPHTRIEVDTGLSSSNSPRHESAPQYSRLDQRQKYRPRIDVNDLFGRPTIRQSSEGVEDRVRGVTSRPVKRLVVYQQSKLRGSDLLHAEKLEMVRTRLNDLMGIIRTKDVIDVAVADEDDVVEYAEGDREPPRLMPHRPFFGENWLKAKWNHHLAELFIDDFAEHYKLDLDDSGRDDVLTMYTNRLDTLRRKWRSLTRDISDEEAEEAKVERRVAMGKMNTRRVALFDVRRDICANSVLKPDGSHDKGWKAHLDLVLALGPGGMSSDESDIEDNSGSRRKAVYRIRKRQWRSREVTDQLVFIDSHRNTTNGKGQARPGNTMRERVRSAKNRASTRDPVIECPANFYDEGFLSNLTNLHYRALNMKKAIQLPEIVE